MVVVAAAAVVVVVAAVVVLLGCRFVLALAPSPVIMLDEDESSTFEAGCSASSCAPAPS